MGNILICIEIIWVGGVIAVIVFYFVIKRNLRKKKENDLTAKTIMGTMKELKPAESQRC